MPSLDHTGPKGEGPKTGRKLGLCRKSPEEQQQMKLQGERIRRRSRSGAGHGWGKRDK